MDDVAVMEREWREAGKVEGELEEMIQALSTRIKILRVDGEVEEACRLADSRALAQLELKRIKALVQRLEAMYFTAKRRNCRRN